MSVGLCRYHSKLSSTGDCISEVTDCRKKWNIWDAGRIEKLELDWFFPGLSRVHCSRST